MSAPAATPSASQPLPRRMIVRRPALLHAARKAMRRFGDNALLLYVQRVSPEGLAKDGAAAFLTPKKVGTAVIRQRTRRRMREIFRREIPWRACSLRWLWIAQNPSAQLSFDDLRARMLTLSAEARNDLE